MLSRTGSDLIDSRTNYRFDPKENKGSMYPLRPVTLPAVREVKLSKRQRRPPSPFIINTTIASTPRPPRQKKDMKLRPLRHRLTFKKGRISREDGSSIAVLRWGSCGSRGGTGPPAGAQQDTGEKRPPPWHRQPTPGSGSPLQPPGTFAALQEFVFIFLIPTLYDRC